MGARKRKARRAREAAFALLKTDGKKPDPAKLALLRSIYRIGERLRPCPGCENCAVLHLQYAFSQLTIRESWVVWKGGVKIAVIHCEPYRRRPVMNWGDGVSTDAASVLALVGYVLRRMGIWTATRRTPLSVSTDSTPPPARCENGLILARRQPKKAQR